jgi:hypothetical protein
MASGVTFGACLWLATAIKLSFLPKAEADRWAVAAAFAGAMAAAVLAWGASWAGKENQPGSANNGTETVTEQQVIESPGTVLLGRGARVKARDIQVTFNPQPVPHPGRDEVGPPKA